MHGVRISGVNRLALHNDADHGENDIIYDEEEELLNSLSPIVRINVGGQLFETSERTLKKMPTRLTSLSKECLYWRPERGEYFFDRDPKIFRSILTFHRTGELHLPLDVCGPQIENELRFWKINERKIEKCCWIHYVRLKGQKVSLIEFEEFFSCKEPVFKEVPMDFSNSTCCNLRHIMRSFRRHGWTFFQRPQSSRWSMAYAIFSSIVVLLSIMSLLCATMDYFVETSIKNDSSIVQNASWLETGVNSLKKEQFNAVVERKVWIGLEIVDFACVIFFSVDIFLQFLCSCNRFVFIRSPMTISEILAIFPYYCDFITHLFEIEHMPVLKSMVEAVHIMRIFGVMRIFKLLKHQTGIQVLFYTLKTSFKELILMVTFVCVATLIFSSLIYFLDDRTVFKSIPLSMWWSIVTLTTVGYGDYCPRTFGGFVTGSLCALTGVLVVAFTVPILVNSFMLFYSHAHSMNIHREHVIKPNERLRTLFCKMNIKRKNHLTKNLLLTKRGGNSTNKTSESFDSDNT